MSIRFGLCFALVGIVAAAVPAVVARALTLQGEVAQIQLPQIPNIPKEGALVTPKTPTITRPRPGVAVRSPILVKGTTSPDAKVTVTATLQVPVPLTSLDQRLGEASTTADGKGNWQVTLAFSSQMLVKSKDAQIILEAVAANPLTGTKSQATKVALKPR